MSYTKISNNDRRKTARIIAEGIAKELSMTPGEEQTCDSR